MNRRRVATLVLFALPLACTSSGPSAVEDRVREPWVTLKGGLLRVEDGEGSRQHLDADHVGGVRRDPTPGCRRFVIAEPRRASTSIFAGSRAIKRRSCTPSGRATGDPGNNNPSDPIRNDSYYDEDGRPLLALQTKAMIADCPLETAFSRRSAAVLSTDLSGMSPRFGPDGSEVDAEFMVVFAGPPEAASEWSTRRSLFMASDKVINAKPGILPDGRVVLFQHDEPQVILTDPDAGTWRGVRSTTTNLMDAMIVGDRAVLQTDTDELRFMRFTGADEDLVHAAPERSSARWPATASTRCTGSSCRSTAPTRRGPGRSLLRSSCARRRSRRTTSRSRRGRWPGSSTGATATCSAGADRSPRRFTPSQLPHLGVGPGGVFGHVDRETEDVVILARPQEDKGVGLDDRRRDPHTRARIRDASVG
ncbi:MAG: hypothetical protein IPO88_22725 [Nannocystis sp.]|uniref:hypothetical protein n=1 Tax=Nannocystis sp. TaxID=1962667 RepID=UPI002420F76C|nr:hypothetical protein [Nannocystis sp.]MBK9756257.1 hypothetical protein [Nannocystis sp.]